MNARSYNAAHDFIDRNVIEGRGGKTAFIDPRRSSSYAELQTATYRMRGLLSAHGLRQEDRVALLLHDTVDFPVAFWGAIRAGVIPVALNTLLSTEQYAYILADSRARALFVSEALLETVGPALERCPHLETVFVSGEGGGGPHLDFGEALAAAPEAGQDAETFADDVAFWLYSSGSTGMPKGVLHVQSSLRATHDSYGAQVLGIREDDRVFSAAKLFFAYGLGAGMTFPLAVGATTVLHDGRPTPDAVFEVLAKHEPTLFFGVPTLYSALLANGAGAPGKTSPRLRRCVSAGEALPKDIGERWRERVGIDVIDGVGSTEMLHIFLSNRPGDVEYGRSGRPVPGYDLRLVDERGAEVPAGEVGELLVRGDSGAQGYFNQREKSRRTFEGAWTRTGDKYTRDEAGVYTYQGRTDDMFKVSGIWVSPFEVESALVAHPAVLEAAVVPYEDEEELVKPRAFVVPKTPPADEDELRAELKGFVKDAIGKWKYPRDIVFLDVLPKTATGKVQRFKLRS